MKQTITVYTSDLSGEPGATPHKVVLDGRVYEIDLTEEEWANIAVPIKSVARRSTNGPKRPGLGAWAIKEGLRKPGQKGAYSKEILDRYDQAHRGG